MLSTMTMELIPGMGLGPFQLGDTLWQTLDQLRSNKDRFPKVELRWNPEDPANSAVTIHLPSLIVLYFPASTSQRLQLIKLPDLPKSVAAGLSITYETQVIASSNVTLTRSTIGRVLGPTFETAAGAEGRSDLSFPGVSFGFAGGSRERREDGVATMTISQGCGPNDLIPQSIREVPALAGSLESCVIDPGKGVTLRFYPTAQASPLSIIIGETSSQDLLLDLGPPLRKFWKEDTRLQRMWGKTELQISQPCFWNYFQLGLDFLVDEADHKVRKIVVHSNIPGTPMFQRYARCPWSVSTRDGHDFTSPISAFSAGENAAFVNGEARKERRKAKGSSPVGVESASMTLDRASEGGLEGVIGLGTSRMVLELEEKGGIGSVTVF